MQILHVDATKRQRVQEIAKRVFGINLHFDAISKDIGLRVGEPGVAVPLADQIDVDYADAMARLPQLSDQGDGIKSALGLIIPLITTDYPISLIDEPEAFLHPPQARIIGAEIASLAQANQSQIFLATHEKNVLVGLVQSGAPVTILHLTRTEDTAAAILLDSADVAELWKDVTLRYGDALDGLFHRAVIVTESDRDSHFYSAAIDSAYSESSSNPTAHNLMFLGSNGKQNMAPIVRRLRKLGIRTVSCPDLDVLNNPVVLRKLVEAHGGNWEDLDQVYKRATNEFTGQPQPPTVDDVKAKLAETLEKNTDDRLTEALAEALSRAVAIPKTNWGKLKESGDRAFKADKASATALLDALDELGIVTVRIGVLENFVTTTSAPKGPEFLPIALGVNAHTEEPARQQAKRLLKAAGIGS